MFGVMPVCSQDATSCSCDNNVSIPIIIISNCMPPSVCVLSKWVDVRFTTPLCHTLGFCVNNLPFKIPRDRFRMWMYWTWPNMTQKLGPGDELTLSRQLKWNHGHWLCLSFDPITCSLAWHTVNDLNISKVDSCIARARPIMCWRGLF